MATWIIVGLSTLAVVLATALCLVLKVFSSLLDTMFRRNK